MGYCDACHNMWQANFDIFLTHIDRKNPFPFDYKKNCTVMLLFFMSINHAAQRRGIKIEEIRNENFQCHNLMWVFSLKDICVNPLMAAV